ncbi:MAG TPA: hypothetical protein H9931_07800 [Candidatus Enterocloster excrementigallinarum]|uniref:Uncharacterized protein n=2 Tax=Enterocloster TaxID=2719313 RepID=A0A9D2L776_9FIRM|nr:hypothetical protein [Candidatus Enterocloster faecavium]HJC66605.1 hypothetical protein [Candidatus Enterocloster excrementigallinarum]
MRFRTKRVLATVIIAVILIFGVPIFINECYKHGGYVTLWNASDVLSYYGTLLTAAVTIVTLWGTIIFTRKQIHHDNYLREEQEKWRKIETIFTEALNSINPISIFTSTMDNGLADPTAAINLLQKYQISCKTIVDKLNAYLNIVDYPKVKDLHGEMKTVSDQYFQIGQELVNEYTNLRLLSHRQAAQETLDIEARNPGTSSPETILFCRNVLRDTDSIQLEDIQNNIANCNKKFVSEYENSFRKLLQKKGATFEIINRDIQKQANDILYLWRR